MGNTTCSAVNTSGAPCTKEPGHLERHTYKRDRSSYFTQYNLDNKTRRNQQKSDRERAVDPVKRSKLNRQKKYNITPEEVQKFYDDQLGLCPVCNESVSVDWASPVFTIDHDHRCCPEGRSCGRCVRGILHPMCNKNLGVLEKYADMGKITIEGDLAEYVRSRRGTR